jgi:hypothetical protein
MRRVDDVADLVDNTAAASTAGSPLSPKATTTTAAAAVSSITITPNANAGSAGGGTTASTGVDAATDLEGGGISNLMFTSITGVCPDPDAYFFYDAGSC